MGNKTAIKLNKTLCQRAATHAEKTGYSSLEELLEHLIEKELARSEEADSKEDLTAKLKGLGYLD